MYLYRARSGILTHLFSIVRKSDQWYKMSQYNHPVRDFIERTVFPLSNTSKQYDMGLCAYTSQLRIMARFHDEVYSDADSPTGIDEVSFSFVSLRLCAV